MVKIIAILVIIVQIMKVSNGFFIVLQKLFLLIDDIGVFFVVVHQFSQSLCVPGGKFL